jgi:cell division protein FtsW (lipid II flippase)
VDLVCEQIRWKKAHFRIAEEIENHITDQRDSFMAQGLDEEAATDRAIAHTGDAITIGAQLDRTHRPRLQWDMLAVTAVLLALGLLVRLFIFNGEDKVGFMSVQLFFISIGIVGMLIAYFVDFSLLGKYPKAIHFSITAFFIAFLFLSPMIDGRLYYIQYITLLFPLAFVLVILATRNQRYTGIILCGLAFAFQAFIALIISLPSSLFGFLHFTIVDMALLSIALWKNWFGVKRSYGFLLTLAQIVLTLYAFIVSMITPPWRNLFAERLAIAFNPSLDLPGLGYLSVMTRELLSGAKLFGPGNIPEEYIYLLTGPRTIFYTDSLLTALISLVGWIAFIVVAGVILFFIFRGFRLCFQQKSSLGFFVSLSIMMTFSIQVISYVVFNLGFQLTSPMSLPLISYGNTATVINLALIGFLLSVFRTGDVVTDEKSPAAAIRNKFITLEDGKLTIYFKAQQRYEGTGQDR